MIYSIATMDAQVQINGFGDYLHNCGRGEWKDCVDDLQAIGATATARVMLRALEIVGDTPFERLDEHPNRNLQHLSFEYDKAIAADDLGVKYEAHLTRA